MTFNTIWCTHRLINSTLYAALLLFTISTLSLCLKQRVTGMCTCLQENLLHWRSNHCLNGRSPAHPSAHLSHAHSLGSKYLKCSAGFFIILHLANTWGACSHYSAFPWALFFIFSWKSSGQAVTQRHCACAVLLKDEKNSTFQRIKGHRTMKINWCTAFPGD